MTTIFILSLPIFWKKLLCGVIYDYRIIQALSIRFFDADVYLLNGEKMEK